MKTGRHGERLPVLSCLGQGEVNPWLRLRRQVGEGHFPAGSSVDSTPAGFNAATMRLS